ncbi:MAG: hypothetical protein H7X92_09725 [Chitinophagales bacterium]|nr:hypothetical protein [Hyphomicrobiales bacterium]
MTASKWGVRLLGFSIVTTLAIVAVADVFNAEHLFNPNWPPHARLHNAMQATTLTILCIVSFIALMRTPRSRESLAIAALAPISFWPGLLLAPLVPGTSLYASEELRSLGFPINLVIAVLWLCLTVAAYVLATRGLPRNGA